MRALESAERSEGWQQYCLSRELFVSPNDEFVQALANSLGDTDEVLEVAAGTGNLAGALRQHGVRITATDPRPGGPEVLAMDAVAALKEFRPRSVFSCFPPLDAGIESAVFRCPSVKTFTYIGPTVYGQVSPAWDLSPATWDQVSPGEVNRFLISRLDYLSDFTRRTWKQKAQAVCFVRKDRKQ